MIEKLLYLGPRELSTCFDSTVPVFRGRIPLPYLSGFQNEAMQLGDFMLEHVSFFMVAAILMLDNEHRQPITEAYIQIIFVTFFYNAPVIRIADRRMHDRQVLHSLHDFTDGIIVLVKRPALEIHGVKCTVLWINRRDVVGKEII